MLEFALAAGERQQGLEQALMFGAGGEQLLACCAERLLIRARVGEHALQ